MFLKILNIGVYFPEYTVYNVYGSAVRPRPAGRGHTKRGRPRGSRSRVAGNISRNNIGLNGPITVGVGSGKLSILSILTSSPFLYGF